MDLLFTLASFVVALAILISVHEFGHFWVARKLGVKVLTFSIGFGKSIWKKTGKVDETEYVIAAIPLGGYVKMLDEREAPVAEHELHRAFNRQSLLTRTAIVSAGPVFNFIFAILAYWLVFVVGETGVKPIVGEVAPSSQAAIAGIESGDMFRKIGERQVTTWENTVFALLEASIDGETVRVEVEDSQSYPRALDLSLANVRPDDQEKTVIEQLGITPFSPTLEPVIGQVVPGEAAERAGLQSGDHITTVNDQPVSDWLAWVKIVRDNPNSELAISYLRDNQEIRVSITPAAFESEEGQIGRIGATVHVPDGFVEKYQAIARYGVFESVWLSVEKTWDFSVLTLKVLGKIITGEASINNLSGPISIAQTAGQTASIGFMYFIKFLAIVSISLGVLNLLPIPVLDGGHLLFYAIEAIRGKALSDAVIEMGQRVGMVLLLGLMFVAFYVDLNRLFS